MAKLSDFPIGSIVYIADRYPYCQLLVVSEPYPESGEIEYLWWNVDNGDYWIGEIDRTIRHAVCSKASSETLDFRLVDNSNDTG